MVYITMVTYIQGSYRPGKVLEFDLGPGKLLEFEKKVPFVLEYCKIILEIGTSP